MTGRNSSMALRAHVQAPVSALLRDASLSGLLMLANDQDPLLILYDG